MTSHFDVALQAELDRRRTSLVQDAEQHQLARLAGQARATAARLTRTRRRTPAPTARVPARV